LSVSIPSLYLLLENRQTSIRGKFGDWGKRLKSTRSREKNKDRELCSFLCP